MDATSLIQQAYRADPAEKREAQKEAFTRSAEDAQKQAFAPFGEDGFSFLDVLDIINPLQHIPVVSTIYRNVTGDEIGAAARVAGGALFGGPIGAVGSLVNAVVDETTGKDIGEHAMALLEGLDDPDTELPTQVAEWPEGGLAPAAVQSEPLAPPPGAEAAPAEEATDPALFAWSVGDPGAAGLDAVTAWARRETALRRGENAEVASVKAWAEQETAYRQAQADPQQRQPERPGQGPDAVSRWAQREAREMPALAARNQDPAEQARPAVLLAQDEAQGGGDADRVARDQTRRLAERSRDDHMPETLLAQAIADSEDWFAQRLTQGLQRHGNGRNPAAVRQGGGASGG